MSSSSEENEKHTRHMCFEPDILKILGQLEMEKVRGCFCGCHGQISR